MNKKNAGFSLVELIVVIAIMAVLVGVLAPAYLRYVEKSRKSADVSAVDEMLKAADTVTSDTQFVIDAGSTYELAGNGGTITLTFTLSTSSTSLEVYAATSQDAVQTEWIDVANIKEGQYDLRSRDFRAASGTATGTVQANGTVTWVIEESGEPSADGDLFQRMGNHSTDIWNKLTTGASSSN